MTHYDTINLCESGRHHHDPSCRWACDICDVLLHPSDFIDGVCPDCWRKHMAEMAEAAHPCATWEVE